MTGIHEKDWPSLIAGIVTLIIIDVGLFFSGVTVFATLAAVPVAIVAGLLVNYLLYGDITPHIIKDPDGAR
jgi:hypothetical protein